MDTTSSTRDLVSPKPSKTFEQNLSPDGMPKDWKFWCIIFSLALSVLLTAVEFVNHLSFFFCLNVGLTRRLDKKKRIDWNWGSAADDHSRLEGPAVHMGRFRVYIGLHSTRTPLWWASAGTTTTFCGKCEERQWLHCISFCIRS
jgi:hypothetical protein